MRKSHIRILTVLICCSTLLSCAQIEEIDFERTVLNIYNQQFEILTAWQLLEKYNKSSLNYEKGIYNKIVNEFNHDTEFPFLYNSISEPIKKGKDLEEVVAMMTAIDYEMAVDTTYQRVINHLAGPDTKILFLPANPKYREIYQEFGIGFHAFTPGAGKIIVTFDPTFKNWKTLLPYALAHEYHHSVWASRNFETANLSPIEYIIFEGRADLFANVIFPEGRHPFTDRLDREQMDRIWEHIKPNLNNRNQEWTEKLYYGSENIPYGSVYSIGFDLVQSFKKNHPEISDMELIDLSPIDILEGSKYRIIPD